MPRPQAHTDHAKRFELTDWARWPTSDWPSAPNPYQVPK
jgi:hypothetical protein